MKMLGEWLGNELGLDDFEVLGIELGLVLGCLLGDVDGAGRNSAPNLA
jgi:hypothetical protein